jgi:hypothetical protein
VRGTTELGAGAHDACREGGFPLNQPSADRSDRVADHARSARSAVEEIGFDSPIDPEVQRDSSEVDLPRRVWVLLDAENLPANGLDYATPEEMASRAARMAAAPSVTVPTSHPVPAGWVTVETAAMSLDTTPDALRKRLNRAARRDRHGVRADLNGIEGRQIGGSWRIRFSGAWRDDR